ncbi:MAG: hypothetical protein V3W44_02240 [Dehalococcoidales bacterium]
MKSTSFDIEIARMIPEGAKDWDKYRPLGISCAATVASDDLSPTLWFDGQYSGGVHHGPKMTRGGCKELVWYLEGQSECGYTPLTWNGCGFDFKILAEESGLVNECKKLARDHVDMMLHIFALKGFPIGLDAACKGMGLPGKPEGMHGGLAPEMWAKGRYKECLDYVSGDVEQPLELARLVEERHALRWVTRKGALASVPIDRWLTVREALKLPEPNTGWMDDPWPRSKFTAWLEK